MEENPISRKNGNLRFCHRALRAKLQGLTPQLAHSRPKWQNARLKRLEIVEKEAVEVDLS
jgi:hypothetical protein